jgi:pyruvate formate lyase activating enzyme
MTNTENADRPETEEPVRGLVFNIQKFSLHDGSGIRTLVFLKGCPLTCEWCANPEGQAYTPELASRPERCIGSSECDRCRQVCEVDAIRFGEDGRVEIARELCTDCGKCVEACPSKALELFGAWMTVDELIRIVEEDSSFYARSGGGVTLSGGEPLAQTEFVLAFLNRARDRGIHTALETSGLCKWEDLEQVCRLVNHLFFDVKTLDGSRHEEGAGVGNELILENLVRLSDTFPELPVTVRTPVVPGFNDAPEDIKAIAAFLDRLPGGRKGRSSGGGVDYELLPYHRLGETKYSQLGKAYPLQGLEPPPKERIEDLRRLLERQLMDP